MTDTDTDFDPKKAKAIGTTALKTMKKVEKLFADHDKILPNIHAGIIAFGLELDALRNLYPFDNNAFAAAVTEFQLDTGRIFGLAPQRTAAMTIARLATDGFTLNGEEDGEVPQKLDLSECFRARPTDILDWARKNQPHLFKDLVLKKLAAKNKKKAEDDDEDGVPDDGVGDLEGKNPRENNDEIGDDQVVAGLKAENKRLRGVIAKLKKLLRENDIKVEEEDIFELA